MNDAFDNANDDRAALERADVALREEDAAPPRAIILLDGDDPPPPPVDPPAIEPPPPPAPPEGGEGPRREPEENPINYDARTVLLSCEVRSETRLIKGVRLAEAAKIIFAGMPVEIPAGTVFDVESFAPIGAKIPMKIAFADVKILAAMIVHFEASNENALIAAAIEAKKVGILGADGLPARANGHRVIPPHRGRR